MPGKASSPPSLPPSATINDIYNLYSSFTRQHLFFRCRLQSFGLCAPPPSPPPPPHSQSPATDPVVYIDRCGWRVRQAGGRSADDWLTVEQERDRILMQPSPGRYIGERWSFCDRTELAASEFYSLSVVINSSLPLTRWCHSGYSQLIGRDIPHTPMAFVLTVLDLPFPVLF